jgi:methylated-DNA-protein-cysteine methyltransferase related protein
MSNLEQLKIRTLALVAQIPPSRVMTYGQIASVVGFPGYARHVGYILKGISEQEGETLPWFRVINGNGGISTYKVGSGERQKALLEAEGIVVVGVKCRLERYVWEPEFGE